MNKLPEKLNLLRKSSGISQAEMARKLLVPVAEYMNWENGNSIPDIEQLKTIAELFHVDLSALLDNNMTFVAPAVNTNAKSAEIPFMNEEATQDISDDLEATRIASGTYSNTAKKESTGQTKQLNTMDLEDITEDNDLGEDARVSRKQNTSKKKKQPAKKKKKKSSLILILCAAAALAVLGLILIFHGGFGSSNEVKTDDSSRLVLTDRYSLYVNDSGSLEAKGEAGDAVDTLTGSVQISGRNADNVIGLKKNGRVVTTNSSLDTSDWKDIVQVAAGENHAVGLKSDGTVVCVGSDSACDVSDWTNIAEVYAGDEVTVGLTEDGSFVSSGGVGIPSVTGVKTAALSNEALYYEQSNGKVSSVALSGGTALSTTRLTGVKQIAAGDDILAGLKSDGTVVVATDDEDIENTVSSWQDVECIAANGSTLIAMTNEGTMYGVGPNTYGQYENTAEGAEATATAESDEDRLDSVENISFNITTETLQISWDKVTHADYYVVEISPDIGTLAKSTGTSASVPDSELEDGTTYQVTITAYSNKKKYKESVASTVNYTYSSKKIQLDTPTNLKAVVESGGAWTISWDAVENADSYILSITGDDNITTNQTYYTISGSALIDGYEYSLSVTAVSSDDSYSDSEPAELSAVYSAESSVEVTIVFMENGSEVGEQALTLAPGEYSADQLGISLPGYTIDPGQVLTVSEDQSEYQVTVTRSE